MKNRHLTNRFFKQNKRMGVKPDNIIAFHSAHFNTYVYLVKKSLGHYTKKGSPFFAETYKFNVGGVEREGKIEIPAKADMIYYRGQLARRWRVCDPATEQEYEYRQGQVIWLDSKYFIQTIIL